jgi:hypothetical protein
MRRLLFVFLATALTTGSWSDSNAAGSFSEAGASISGDSWYCTVAAQHLNAERICKRSRRRLR